MIAIAKLHIYKMYSVRVCCCVRECVLLLEMMIKKKTGEKGRF